MNIKGLNVKGLNVTGLNVKGLNVKGHTMHIENLFEQDIFRPINGVVKADQLDEASALCSAVLGKPVQPRLVTLGSMSLGGNIVPVENLAESLQVAFDAGAKRILLPMASVGDIPTIPGELFAKFQTGFYADPRDAAFKALGVEGVGLPQGTVNLFERGA